MSESASQKQKKAADPQISAFVAAHAGSGKTRTLTQRVLRLLLSGADAGSVLCLTYTKTAAANMANKVFEELASLTTMSANDLESYLIKNHTFPSKDDMQKARKLFAKALETPGGLKVQTIHAFCGKVLRQFPLEAGVSADFEELDDFGKETLIATAIEATLSDIKLSDDLKLISKESSDSTLYELIQQGINTQHDLLNWFHACGNSFDALSLDLRFALGLDYSFETLEHKIRSEMIYPQSEWLAFTEEVIHTNKASATLVKQLEFFSDNAKNTQFDVKPYLAFFITQDLTARETLLNKDIQKKLPLLDPILREEQARLLKLAQMYAAYKIHDRSFALLKILASVFKHYEDLKKKASKLDFDDLIHKTKALLSSKNGISWVQYKLDAGIEHILVDEAQDTSPHQWDIIEALVSSFSGQEDERKLKRTLFAVGDEKQSIYSFQGADPQKMDKMLKYFMQDFKENAQKQFEKITLDTSFRSSQAILSFTDLVLKETQVLEGFITKDIAPHQAEKTDIQGFVELWNFIEKPLKQEENWRDTVDKPPNEKIILAQKIAAKIKDMLERGEILTHLKRAVEPKDFLILCRKRSGVFHPLISALKELNIPIAGADRLKLTEHIAILDLLNCAECVLALHDDLKLTTLLKSPLFNFDEGQIYSLCFGRDDTVLARLEQLYPKQHALILELQQKALHALPHRFFVMLLTEKNLRQIFINRFGQEVDDVLEVFLGEAKNFPRYSAGTLRHFCADLRAKDNDIKRDTELSRNEVRVMTVHGAKGLEAEIVFLADCAQSEATSNKTYLYKLDTISEKQNSGSPLVWLNGKDNVSLALESKVKKKAKDKEESQRLLYVALTRAISRLYLCGAGELKDNAEHWYATLKNLFEVDNAIECPIVGQVWRLPNKPLPEARSLEEKSVINIQNALPAFVTFELEKKPLSFSKQEKLTEAQNYGVLLHKLLEYLPPISFERREKAARVFLSKTDLAENLREKLLSDVFAILNHVDLQTFYGDNSYSEVMLYDDNQELRLDRLIIEENRVFIVDYKTTQFTPNSKAQIPSKILTQMQQYLRVVQKAYPSKQIEVCVVFTQPITVYHFTKKELNALSLT